MFWMAVIFVGFIFLPLTIMVVMSCQEIGWKIGGATFLLVLWLGAAFVLATETEHNDTVWNNGYCISCGTHWELVDVVKAQSGNIYKYYQCPDYHTEIKMYGG